MPGRDTEVKINETLLPEQLMLSLKFGQRFEELIDVGCRYVTVTIVLRVMLVAFIIPSGNGTLHHNLCGELRDWVTSHDASTTPSPCFALPPVLPPHTKHRLVRSNDPTIDNYKPKDPHSPTTRIALTTSSLNVPILISTAPATFARSSISSGAVAMMGDPPAARVMLADWVVTTVFVI